MEKLTQWQTFFMLLTVIPFSKLILAVLVKTVMPNKPEGNRWSTSIMGVGMALSALGRVRPFGRRTRGGRPGGGWQYVGGPGVVPLGGRSPGSGLLTAGGAPKTQKP